MTTWRTAAQQGIRVPLAETGRRRLGARAKRRAGAGRPFTAAAGTLRVHDGRVHGSAAASWARSAGHAVVLLERAGELLVAFCPLDEGERPVVEPGTDPDERTASH